MYEYEKQESEKGNESYLKLYVPARPAEMEGKMDQLPTIDMAATGSNIARLRKLNGFSVRDLQDVFGFSSPQAIYRWQQGAALPAVDNLVILAALFHVRVDDILILHASASAKTA